MEFSIFILRSVVALVALVGITGQTVVPAEPKNGVEIQEPGEIGIGILNYPAASEQIEATKRLAQMRGGTWLAAGAYHSDDSIKYVIKFFKREAEKVNPKKQSGVLGSLQKDNWAIKQTPLQSAPKVFVVTKELKEPRPTQKIEWSFGVIVLGDSFVRVHLMSPAQSSSTNDKLVSGTMIVLIRERLPDPVTTSSSEGEGEKIYTGAEVTQRARIISKPYPPHPGGQGHLVVLKVVFSSTGKVTLIRVMTTSPLDQFTKAAIEAARKIKFEPAIKDGRYVSQWMQLEYNFFP